MNILSGLFGRTDHTRSSSKNKASSNTTPLSVDESYDDESSSLDYYDDDEVHEEEAALMSPNCALEHADDQQFLHNHPTMKKGLSSDVPSNHHHATTTKASMAAANPNSSSDNFTSVSSLNQVSCSNNNKSLLASVHLTQPSDMDMSMLSSLKADIGFISKAPQKAHPACAVGVFELSNLSSFRPPPSLHEEEDGMVVQPLSSSSQENHFLSTPTKNPRVFSQHSDVEPESEDGLSSYSLPSSCKSDRMIYTQLNHNLNTSGGSSSIRRMKTNGSYSSKSHVVARKEYLALTNSLQSFLKELSEQVLSHHALTEKAMNRMLKEDHQIQGTMMNEWREHVERDVKEHLKELKTFVQDQYENTRTVCQHHFETLMSNHDEKQKECIRELQIVIENNRQEIKTLKLLVAGIIGLSLLCVIGQIYCISSTNHR